MAPKKGVEGTNPNSPTPRPQADEHAATRSHDPGTDRNAGASERQAPASLSEIESLKHKIEDLTQDLKVVKWNAQKRIEGENAAQKRADRLKEELERVLEDIGSKKKLLREIEELVQRRDALTNELETHETDLRRLHELDGREGEVGTREENVQESERRIGEDKANLATQSKELEVARRNVEQSEERHREARRELRELREENGKLSAKVTSAKKAAAGLERRLGEAARELEEARALTNDRPALHIEDWRVVQWLLRDVDIDREVLGDKVALDGNGPWQSDDLRRLVTREGSKVGKCGAPKAAGTLIVGRTGYSLKDIEKHVLNRKSEDLYIFPQELLIASLLVGRNPFEERDDVGTREVLEMFGKGHPVIERLRGQFPWPEIGMVGPPTDISDVDQVGESPLVKLGYHVGKHQGLSMTDRHAVLGKAFLKPLPFVESNEYMEKWGDPGSWKRLWRMAWHLTWLARKNGSKPGFDVAVGQWKRDLDWLRSEHYKAMMRFAWP